MLKRIACGAAFFALLASTVTGLEAAKVRPANRARGEVIPAGAAQVGREILSRFWIKCGDSYFHPQMESQVMSEWWETLYLTEYKGVSDLIVRGDESRYVNGREIPTFAPSPAEKMNGVAWKASLSPRVSLSRSMKFRIRKGEPNLYLEVKEPWSEWEDHPFGGSIIFSFYEKNGVILESSTNKPLDEYLTQLPELPNCSEIPK
jgi:hypothetical protein